MNSKGAATQFIKFLLIIFGAYLLLVFFTGYEFSPFEQVEAPQQQPAEVLGEPLPSLTLAQPEMQQPIEEAPAPEVESPVLQVEEANKLTTDDLLPKYDEANEFVKQNPVSALLKEQNFLVSGYHAGINTVMQSNKIPYYDLRSAPPIPKESAGPWSQSSFENPAGAGRRQLEIGVN
jgi:hypothetical protein